MNNIFNLRIDAKLANSFANDEHTPITAIRKSKARRRSPLTKCTGRGACGSTNCMLRAHHLGQCVWRGGYLPDFMKQYLLDDDLNHCP